MKNNKNGMLQPIYGWPRDNCWIKHGGVWWPWAKWIWTKKWENWKNEEKIYGEDAWRNWNGRKEWFMLRKAFPLFPTQKFNKKGFIVIFRVTFICWLMEEWVLVILWVIFQVQLCTGLENDHPWFLQPFRKKTQLKRMTNNLI